MKYIHTITNVSSYNLQHILGYLLNQSLTNDSADMAIRIDTELRTI